MSDDTEISSRVIYIYTLLAQYIQYIIFFHLNNRKVVDISSTPTSRNSLIGI